LFAVFPASDGVAEEFYGEIIHVGRESHAISVYCFRA